MLSTGMKFFTEVPLTVMGMLIFFGFFLAATYWTFQVRQKKFYQQLAEMPLNEEGE